MKKITLLSLSLAGLSQIVSAGSFQLNLQGMQQTAMGGTGVARPWDVSTIFFNPAGLSSIKGIQAYGNVFFVSPSVRYVTIPTGVGYSETEKHTSTPFALYVGGTLKKNEKIGLGLGIYTPFGSSANWGDNWTGRYIVQSIALQSIFIQPTASYQVTDKLGIGAGFVYATGGVEINKAVPLQDLNANDGKANLKGRAGGMGFNVGVNYKVNEQLQLGLSYRSGVKMKVKEGDATFTVPSAVASNFPGTNFSTQLPLPSITTLGLAYKPAENFTLQLDLVYAGWSAYDSLKFDFVQNTATLKDTRDPRNYKNTLAYRIGVCYQVNKDIAVMAGGAWDPTPTQDNLLSPDAVDANRINLSCGASYSPIKDLKVLIAFNYTTTATREATYEPANFSGAYQIRSLVPGIGISYKF